MSRKVPMAIAGLHDDENSLVQELVRISDDHLGDHGVCAVARDLARWSERHVAELARVGGDYGLALDPEPRREQPVVRHARQERARLLSGHHDSGLWLLNDLRCIYRIAAGVSLDWDVLAQTAQALQDHELLTVSETCHPETVRQMKWAEAQLKSAATQVMVT